MKISILGLGYVGSVSAACLADRGAHVVGVDVDAAKVNWINQGQSPVVEPRLAEIVAKANASGQLCATTDVADAVARTDVSLVCVGTPSKANGDLDLQYVCRVAEQLGTALAAKKRRHTVVVRSTVLPGTTWDVVRPILENRSGLRAGPDFGLCFNPEFLREGSAVADFDSPPFTIVGVQDDADARLLRSLYSWLDAEFIATGIALAETVKYVNNCFHALKVAFANEVGRLCRATGVDSHRLMEIFCKDKKQNLSSYYLKPGYAFGGSCLPKDLRAILYKAKMVDVDLELFRAVLNSNRTQVELGVEMVERLGRRKVGMLGLSFKAGTDDLRESPLVTLAETLCGRGYTVRIYDEHVRLSQLVGSNKAYLEQKLPHISAMLDDSAERVVADSETIVVGNANPAFRDIVARMPADKQVVDLVRITKDLRGLSTNYHGIGW
ncbi:MAG: UDP-glucose/GDP-mannose dehydrogenase family protein [Planctomycetia bacterium]|nr:UDP-glucose/GDP-mannose dehydrogenase family protein [Planctomycetia bacterium]